MTGDYFVPLLALDWLKTPILILFFIASVLLILVVLMQKSKEGGLAGAFGMGGDSSVLGTRAGTFLSKVTIALAIIFLGLAMTYVLLDYRP